jgi:hypothetical protein
MNANPLPPLTWEVIEGGAKKGTSQLLGKILKFGGSVGLALSYLADPGVGGDWANSKDAQFESECRERRKRCGADLLELYNVMEQIRVRYYEMMTDPLDLFHTAFSLPNPANPKAGSWVGHQHQFEGRQGRLRNLIEKLRKNGCEVPPEAELLEALPTPKFPGWK